MLWSLVGTVIGILFVGILLEIEVVGDDTRILIHTCKSTVKSNCGVVIFTMMGNKIQASILPSVAVLLQVMIGKQTMCGGRILSRPGARTGGPQATYRTLIWLL